MSKAFVIKNKEGKYLAVSSSDYEHYWTTIDFAHYFRFLNGTHDAKQEAEEFRVSRYPDCEVVEITIEEVDKNLLPQNYDNLSIEDKLKYRENQVRIARDRDVEYNNKITELEFTIKRLEQQLSEKDKEIEELKMSVLFEQEHKNKALDKLKEIRKQVCNKIKREIANLENIELSSYMTLCNIIDKIKQGE